MSDSSRPQSEDTPPPDVVEGWLTATHEALDRREALCKQIAYVANLASLDCDWQFVNRHLVWFKRWYFGTIATGYLMGRTGVKRKKISIEHWSE